MTEFIPTWLMIKQHQKTGLTYFCKTTRSDPCRYKGSGTRWTNHLKNHGRLVDTIWCKLFENKQELMEYALCFSRENNIVESIEWANLVPEDGITGWPPGAKHRLDSIEKCRINAKGFKKGHVPHNLGKTNSPSHYKNQIEGQQRYRKNNPNWAVNWLAGKEKAEPRRVANLKKRLTGSNNHNYDHTLYTFENKVSLEQITLTRNDFIKTFNCPSQNVYGLINGNRKSVCGWRLIPNLVTI